MKISILGSTGSIGTSTLAVIKKYHERFDVVGLAAARNIECLARQIKEFEPRLVCVAEREAAVKLKSLLPGRTGTKILTGQEGLQEIATLHDADMIVAAMSGSAGLVPTLAAVHAGKTIALANKETLVMAGELIIQEAKNTDCRIIPVDSEHSAVYQLLQGRASGDVRTIILTASGGPFLNYTKEKLEHVTPAEALQHPRWKMGLKVTTDSASLMNKGLEVIEAHWLFGIPAEQIRVVIHPQSIIHAMVEFVDGTLCAQLSQPDMQAPIAYALSCPARLMDVIAPLNIENIGTLTFNKPDTEMFPALRLAYDALAQRGLMPAVMNAANEVAVRKFHENALRFTQIPKLIGRVMEKFHNEQNVTLENVLWADQWARQETERALSEITCYNKTAE